MGGGTVTRADDREVYLGDGVAASTDGFHLVLTADGTKTVWLDPSVFRALLRYAASIDFPGLEG
jgi:hypothetical protein